MVVEEAVDEAPDGLAHAQYVMVVAGESGDEPVKTELLPAWPAGLGDAVGVEDDPVTRVQLPLADRRLQFAQVGAEWVGGRAVEGGPLPSRSRSGGWWPKLVQLKSPVWVSREARIAVA